MKHFSRIIFFAFVGLFLFGSNIVYAKSAREIDVSVEEALERFKTEVPQAKTLLSKAKGVLVLPGVIQAGFTVGGEYGEGALLVNGETAGYYNTISGSLGFQIGAQVKDMYILFMNRIVLQNFIQSEGWEAGIDGSLALITTGVDGAIDTTQTNQPVLAFVLGQKGLMYNLSLEGSKFNKIEK